MDLLRLDFSEHSSYALVGIGALTVGYIFLRNREQKIPTVGNMFLGGVWAITKNRKMVEEGYRKYPDGIFKIPMFPFGEMVVVNGTKLTNEIRTGANDVFSFDGFFDKMAVASHTIDPEVVANPYHIPIISKTLTRALGSLFGDLVDEMEHAFDDVLQLPTDGSWKSLNIHDAVSIVASRTSNRLVVGSPLCGEEHYYHDAEQYAVDVMTQAHFINLFPTWAHPVVARLVAKPNYYVKRWKQFIGPMVAERWKNLQETGGAWPDKPNDYLMWLIEATPEGQEPDVNHLIKELLMFEFAAIHTTGMALTHALYYLGMHPEYVHPLRQEAEEVIGKHGWSKVSMQKMRKTDSFLREAARLNPTAIIGLIRQMLKDYTFSNGVTVKKGSWVSASSLAVHMDDRIYENASEFMPWRFSDIRAESEEEYVKHQYVVASNEYLAFGAGKHACPGRFFAANELKAMLAYIVLNYDIKFEKPDTPRPENVYIGSAIVPNSKAMMMMRQRPHRKRYSVTC